MATCAACGRPAPDGAQFCPNCGARLASPDAVRDEERKLVTVLFADLAGSTALGQQVDPERLRAIVDRYFEAMSATIEMWGGSVEKYIGDAIVAIFGVPSVREDDAQRALHAALAMLERLKTLNVELQERHGVQLVVRIGVNSGEVVARRGGSAHQGIVTGDVMNVAARLEQAAEPGTILAGERTHLATRDEFRFGPPVDLQLKGKEGTVRAHPVLGALEQTVAERRGVPGLQAEMIGRDRELATLRGLLDDVAEAGAPSLALISGPAGIGKSRLLRELLRAAVSDANATVLRGRCPPAGQAITYWPLAEIIRAACRIAIDEPPATTVDKLRTGVVELLDPLVLPTAEVERTIFALATTAGFAYPDNPLDHAEPQAIADELAQAWPRLASGLAARAPLVLAIEDLHWASDQLLQILDRLILRSHGPVLTVATARPEFGQSHPTFAAGREETTTVALRPLTERQSSQLVDDLLDVAELPERLRRDILGTAEGNPFFLEQILRRLIDEEAIVRDGDRWRATESASRARLPDTVQALLTARIDTLPPREKRVLQEAAVIGRIFWDTPLARLVGDGPVLDELLALESLGFVMVRPDSSMRGHAEFIFKHVLVRDAAYAALPKSRRARAHAEVAAWLEEIGSDRGEELVDLLADHYSAAVLSEDADLAWTDASEAQQATRRRAFEVLLSAGSAARRRFALDRAVTLHEGAVSLADSSTDRAAALEELADDHEAALRGDESVAAYEEALALVRAAGAGSDQARNDDIARLCLKIARMAQRSGTFRQTLEDAHVAVLVDEGLRLVRDPATRSRLLSQQADWGRLAASPIPLEERIALQREAWDIADSLGEPRLRAEAAGSLADLYEEADSPALALEWLRRQVALAEQLPARERVWILSAASGMIFYLAGDLDEAHRLAERAHLLAEELVAAELSPHLFLHCTFGLMRVLYELGRWSELLELIDAHVDAISRQDTNMTCSTLPGGLLVAALALAHRGEVERAAGLARRAHYAPDRRNYPSGEFWLARYAVVAGDSDVAAAIMDEAKTESRILAAAVQQPRLEALLALERWDELAPAIDEARQQADCHRLLAPLADFAEGRLTAVTGEPERAGQILERAAAEFDRLGVRFEAARAREALASVRPDDAPRLLAEALATYRQLGARPHADRVTALLPLVAEPASDEHPTPP